MRAVSLLTDLENFGTGMVCLTGGGGKTTLLHALGENAAAAGNKTLCTTTTKMYWPDSRNKLPAAFETNPDALVLPGGGAMFAAKPSPPGKDPHKVYGYSADEVETLARRGLFTWTFVEADGAAGRPIKAPAENEPVIPVGTAVVIGVIGLSCMGQAFTPKTVFRTEHFAAITGLAPGATITAEAVAKLVLHPSGLFKNSPDASIRLLFCNQSDLAGSVEAGKAIAKAVFSSNNSFPRAVYLGAARAERLKCLKLAPGQPL